MIYSSGNAALKALIQWAAASEAQHYTEGLHYFPFDDVHLATYLGPLADAFQHKHRRTPAATAAVAGGGCAAAAGADGNRPMSPPEILETPASKDPSAITALSDAAGEDGGEILTGGGATVGDLCSWLLSLVEPLEDMPDSAAQGCAGPISNSSSADQPPILRTPFLQRLEEATAAAGVGGTDDEGGALGDGSLLLREFDAHFELGVIPSSSTATATVAGVQKGTSERMTSY